MNPQIPQPSRIIFLKKKVCYFLNSFSLLLIAFAGGIILVLFQNKAHAQVIPDPYSNVNAELRRIFYPLHPYVTQPAFLDMSLQTVDSLNFNGDLTVQTQPSIWYNGYRQIRSALLDTSTIPRVENIARAALREGRDTIHLLLFSYKYNKIKAHRLDSSNNTYFSFDSLNQSMNLTTGNPNDVFEA